jgi:hypothetical protein
MILTRNAPIPNTLSLSKKLPRLLIRLSQFHLSALTGGISAGQTDVKMLWHVAPIYIQ